MWCGQAELREPEAQTEHARPLPDHASFVRRSYEIEYAAERAAGIGSLESSIPSVSLVGSKISRRSSAALVGEIAPPSEREDRGNVTGIQPASRRE